MVGREVFQGCFLFISDLLQPSSLKREGAFRFYLCYTFQEDNFEIYPTIHTYKVPTFGQVPAMFYFQESYSQGSLFIYVWAELIVYSAEPEFPFKFTEPGQRAAFLGSFTCPFIVDLNKGSNDKYDKNIY